MTKVEAMNWKKIVLAAGLASVLTVGSASAAFAASYTEYPSGGTWNYGENFGGNAYWWVAYSNYYHGSSSHKATTCLNNTSNCTTSGWKPGGSWANSSKLYDSYLNTPKRYWDKA